MLPHSYHFESIGTRWQIDTLRALPDGLKQKLQARIEQFDCTYSRFRPDSLVSAIARQPGTYKFPEDLAPMLALYRSLYDVSGGKFTPLIGSALERAGYDADYSFQQSTQVPVPSWDEELTWNSTTLTTQHPVTLDFGAAGKGYLVDLLSDILSEAGVTDFVIDASGDLRHKGTTDNRVGLEHPNDPTIVIGVINVRNQSLCASATNRRQWGNGMHHIFDPDTQSPTNAIIATWVIAGSAMVADGIATALFMTDPDSLLPRYDFQYVRMHADQSVDYSHNLQGALFL